MIRSLPDVVRELDAFTEADFDYRSPNGGLERLDALCDDVLSLPVPSDTFRYFFRLMERLPDADFGSPGSLVHTMERHIGSYEDMLAESVERKPTSLSIWMVNRILNGKTSDRERWLRLLALAADHPQASEVTRNEARHFIEFQESKKQK